MQATAEYERQQRSQRAGGVSLVDKARSALDASVGRRDRGEAFTLARNRLSYRELTADADGIITTLPSKRVRLLRKVRVVARPSHATA